MEGRQLLPHEIPSWVSSADIWFITICCQRREFVQLTKKETANSLLESVRYRHEHRFWYAHIFLLMPDHCHALLSFPEDRKITQVVRDWKRWTARALGIEWQVDFFEHRLRREEYFSQKWDYILQNPVRANLVTSVENWPFVWRPV